MAKGFCNNCGHRIELHSLDGGCAVRMVYGNQCPCWQAPSDLQHAAAGYVREVELWPAQWGERMAMLFELISMFPPAPPTRFSLLEVD